MRQELHIAIGGCILIALLASLSGCGDRSASTEGSPAPATAAPISSEPKFVLESGVAIQSAEFQQLHLKMPFHKPHEATSWVVDRQEQIYFVAQGGGFRDVPYQFALVLPRRGITVQVEGWMNARGSVAQGFVNTWRMTRVKLAREHESEALRLLDLVRQAMKVMYLSFNPSLTKEVNVELPEPTFT